MSNAIVTSVKLQMSSVWAFTNDTEENISCLSYILCVILSLNYVPGVVSQKFYAANETDNRYILSVVNDLFSKLCTRYCYS